MASDPLRDQLLAQYGAVSDDPLGGLADQIAALQGLRPSEPKDEGWDVFQPVRTFFGATGSIGGQAARLIAPDSYQRAQEEIRASRGITEDSPWYEQVEALPTAGDVAVGAMSPEFRQSGVGRVVEPITRIAGGILGDPTTYLGLGAGKLASSIASRVAPELTVAASAAERAREAAVAAGSLTLAEAKNARLLDAAEIADRVLTAGSPMQQRLFQAGGWVQQAEPLALGAPAALAYGPETIRTAYEQAKGIPESEHPVADAASVALLSGMSLLMGKGLMDANKAIRTWRTHAETHSLTPDVIAQGEAQITSKVQELAPPEMPMVEGELVPPTVTRTPAGIPTAEPISGAPVRVAEAGIPTAEPVTGVTRVATAGEPQLIDQSAVSLEEPPLLPDDAVRLARGPVPKNLVQDVAEPPLPELPPAPPAPEPPPAPVTPPVAPEPPPQAPPAAAVTPEPPVLSERDQLLTDMGHPPAKGEELVAKPQLSLEQQLQASIEAAKQKRVASAQPAAESAPAPKLGEPPVTPPQAAEPPRAVAPPTETPTQPAALSGQETAKWGEYTGSIDTLLGKTKNKANRLLLEDAKAKAVGATPDEQRQILSDIKDNYGGFADRYVKGSKLGLEVQRGEVIHEGTAAKATEPVQMNVQKPVTITKGKEFDTARQVLKDHNVTLRQFMEAPESGVLEYTENKGGGRTTSHNLKDATTRFGKIWNQYVDLLDGGKSDAEARRIVATAAKLSENVVNNVVRAGRANTRLAVLKRYTGADAPTAQEEARAAAGAGRQFLEKQRVTAEKAASDLGTQIEAAGGVGDDILKNAEFKTAAQSTLNELAKHLVGTRALGSRDPLRSLEALKSLAKKMGFAADDFSRNVTGEEIIQKLADKAGIETDYIGAIRGVLRPQPKPTARWKPTILSEGEVSGGKEGFTYTLRKVDDPVVAAADIVNNPEMDAVVFGPDVKGSQLQKIEAALPKDITLHAVGSPDAETLSQAYKIERPKVEQPKVSEARSRDDASAAAMHVDNTPDIQISTQELAKRIAAYEEDLTQALKLGESKLVIGNHDRVMSDGYLRTLQAVGERTAVALEDIHDRLATRLLAAGRTPDGIRTRFTGLTASPHLGGLFHSTGKGEGRVFVNPVEAVNYAGTKEGAVDEMLYHLFHEVAHAESTGHGAEFHDFYQYMRNLAESEGSMPAFRKSLGEAFTDADFARMRDELVPEFRSARSKYGTEHWRAGAEDLAGVPARDLAGGTEAVPGGRGRGQEGVAGDLRAGVRPGANVPGGRKGPAGELRADSAAAGAVARTAAEGSAAGPSLGKGLETALQRIEERATRTGKGILARDDAKVLMDELIEESKATLSPVRDVYRRGYEYARLVEQHLTDTERDDLIKSLPSPTRKDQHEGIINLLRLPDLDKRMKARIALMNDFTKGAWERDRPRPWSTVESEVQDMLGIHSPEEWTRIYKSKGGGLLDRDIELLRTVHQELAGRLLSAEDRLYAALNENVPAETLAKLRAEVNHSEQAFHHAMYNVSKGLTGVARALAVAKHEVRALDPVLAMDQDIQAGLRERMRFKYKDVAEAEAKTQELMTKFREIREKRGNWEEFYKAYRAMLGSKLWPDKILEFYKAGLLSYPSRVANISSNALFRNVRFIEDAVAGALDATRVAVAGGQRERYIGETSVSMLSMQRAVKEAFPEWLKAQGDAFALRPQDIHTAMAKGGLMEDLLQHPGAIGGKTGEFVRFAFKGLSSDDALSKHISRLDTMYREVYRRVQSGEYKLNPGEKTTAAVERHFQSLKDNYDVALSGSGNFDFPKLKTYQKLAALAEETALRDTFQSDLGNFGRGMNWLLRNVPALQIIFPFVRTPTNIAKETLKRTPLGFFNVARKWKDLSEGQRMTELSKPAVGTLLGAGILAQAMGGDVTGGGPVNPDELEALKATGWQPYSVKVGDSWVSYQRLEPIAAIMGIAADAAEGLRNGDFQRWQDGTVKVFQSAAENVTNKTFLSGLDGMFSAVSHPKEYLARFVKQMQGSVVPNGLGFVPVSGIARALDPVYRQTDPFSMNVFWSKLPFLSSTLEPQYGPTGEPRLRPGSAAERVVSPFARTNIQTGPGAVGADEVVRLSAAPRAPGRYWTARGGVRVNFKPEERAALAKSYREATAVIGQRLVNDPNYQRLPDNENDADYRYGMKTKADVVRRLYGKYRDSVMDRIKPGLTARAVQQVNQKEKA